METGFALRLVKHALALPAAMADFAAADQLATTAPPSSAAAATQSVKKTPSEFLKSVIGRPVLVRLTTGADYRGEWKSSRAAALITHAHSRTNERAFG